LLKNSGLANQGDMAKLDWFIIENFFLNHFLQVFKKKIDPIGWCSYYFLQEYVFFNKKYVNFK
jgi:hypothetical protein